MFTIVFSALHLFQILQSTKFQPTLADELQLPPSLTGYYLYAEASRPRRPGHRARLLSPVVTGRTCVAFQFNMHGKDMGTLKVYRKVGSMDQVLWEDSSDRGDTWNAMQINVETSAQFQVCNLLGQIKVTV